MVVRVPHLSYCLISPYTDLSHYSGGCPACPHSHVRENEADMLLENRQAERTLFAGVLRRVTVKREKVSFSRPIGLWSVKQSGYAGPLVLQMET